MVVVDSASFTRTPLLVVAPTFHGYRALQTHLTVDGWGYVAVTEKTIHEDDFGPGRQFTQVTDDPNLGLQSVLNRFRKEITAKGGSPEAVQLLTPLLRFNDEELNTMAEKLSKKSAAGKEKAAAEKAAPAKKAPAAKKGNPEALAKAREASAGAREAAKARKIKPLVKPKELEAREGTFRRTMLEDILKAKTVGEFYDMNEKYDAGCLRFAVDNNIVSIA